MNDSYIKYIIIFILCLPVLISCNPFAPGLDDSPGGTLSLLTDQRNPDGVFQNLKYAYTLRDTLIYGRLFDENFTFAYIDYDHNNMPITWGRDEEMRTTYGLFQSAQRLDLIWNNTVSTSINQDSTKTMISRQFNLTVTFNPNDIIRIDGKATFQMGRQQAQDPWKIVRWNDESNN